MPETPLIDGFHDSLWNNTASVAPVTEPLCESVNCEVVIIGAGFTGLNAALRLASKGVDVKVLEAGKLGIGSSGRSGGQVNLGLNLGPSELIAKFGHKQAEPMIDAVVSAPDYVFKLIREHSIDCDAVQKGWVQAALNPNYLKLQQKLVLDYAQFGLTLDLLDTQALNIKTGTSAYVGGLYCSVAGSIQPLSYTRELARVAISKGAGVYTNSSVQQLMKSNQGWRVDTDKGQINCSTVLVCTNAYTGDLLSELSKTIVPVRTILVASEPLSPKLRASILPGQVTFVDKRRLILYFRYDRDGRLCVGDHGPSRDTFTLTDFAHVKKRAAKVFPSLSDVSWDFHWGGRVAMTKDSLPFMHELAPGLIAGMGYNGRGVAMGSMMGVLLADYILSDAQAEPAFPITRPDKYKMHAFRNIGVSTAIKWFTLRDYLEGL